MMPMNIEIILFLVRFVCFLKEKAAAEQSQTKVESEREWVKKEKWGRVSERKREKKEATSMRKQVF